MLKLPLFFICLLLGSNVASARIYHSFDAKVEFSSKAIQTNETATLNAVSTRRNYLSFNPTVRFHLNESFYFLTDALIGSELDSASDISGFSFGGGYYFLQPGSKSVVTQKNLEYTRNPIYAPFVAISYRQYSLSSASFSVKFSGLRFELGSKIAEIKNLPLTVGISYESMNSGTERELTGVGLFSALSYQF